MGEVTEGIEKEPWKLNDEERKKINDTYYRMLDDYRAVSEHLLDELLRYRADHPTIARIVFSRQPIIKSLSGIIEKIETKRDPSNKKCKPNYSYSELEDIIALTVLCPYQTDIARVITWLKMAFRVLTPDSQALQDEPNGRRAYHYIVKAADHNVKSHIKWKDVKCEIQIKTILDEARDAKTHDYVYKERYGSVTEDLKKQFAVLTTALRGIDER